MSINAFMLGLFRQGAFQGTTPSQAFQVQCDSQTTTQADIDNGIVNIVVAFAPLKPAEFVDHHHRPAGRPDPDHADRHGRDRRKEMRPWPSSPSTSPASTPTSRYRFLVYLRPEHDAGRGGQQGRAR